MIPIVDRLISVIPSENHMKWQKLEFMAFFHYGIISFTDREWGTGKENITEFLPHNLNTDQWCEVLGTAEMKACIITVKHHDG